MTALASTDVTVTVAPQARHVVEKKRRTLLKIQFGNGALTYSTGGVPMPAFGVFGMKRNLDGLLFYDTTGSLYYPSYDSTNNKIKLLQGDNPNAAQAPFVEVANATAIAAQTLYAEAVGW